MSLFDATQAVSDAATKAVHSIDTVNTVVLRLARFLAEDRVLAQLRVADPTLRTEVEGMMTMLDQQYGSLAKAMAGIVDGTDMLRGHLLEFERMVTAEFDGPAR